MAKWLSIIVFFIALLVTMPQMASACESGNVGGIALVFARLLMGLTGAIMLAIFSIGENDDRN